MKTNVIIRMPKKQRNYINKKLLFRYKKFPFQKCTKLQSDLFEVIA